MCGIAGYVGRGDARILEAMGNTLAHRGPDDHGIFCEGNVGLAHRRLSILDLSSAGHQPMSNDDQTVWIVFNGEIYNFTELREKFLSHRTFKSKTDTEVIIRLYEAHGPESFAQLRGMFAFALYDGKKNMLYLARDGMGKKPLYWGKFGDTFLFGSELKALLAHPSCTKKIDRNSLRQYLLTEHVPTPYSILEGISKLEPGHCLSYDGARVTKQSFWNIRLPQKGKEHPREEDVARAQLDEQMKRAVERRLVSDVPLGVFLSGGIDSSTVAWYAKQAKGDIETFSIGFSEDTFDESTYARTVAKALNTNHHEEILDARASVGILHTIAEKLDEPLADASIVPTYLLSRFAREHVTVALSGDGADELFLGYDTFQAEKLARAYALLPQPMRAICKGAAAALPVSFSNMSLDFKLKQFTSGFDMDMRKRHAQWLGAFSDEEILQLLNAGLRGDTESSGDTRSDMLEAFPKADSWNELSYFYERTYLLDQVLLKVDRASMLCGLEVRSPFLDTDVVDYVNALPPNLKLHGMTTKYLLKKLMASRLPADILHRKKKGFGIPVATWLTTELRAEVEHYLGKEFIERQGLFNAPYVARLIDEHWEGKRDHRKRLWTLLVFQLWFEAWIG